MRLTRKQQEEIDYLKTWNKSGIEITEDHVEEYINATVRGQGEGGKMSKNPLVTAKQRLEVTLALWKEDLTIGLISFQELIEDATCDYEKKLIHAVRDSVSGKYRREIFERHKRIENGAKTYPVVTSLAVDNFPDIKKIYEDAI